MTWNHYCPKLRFMITLDTKHCPHCGREALVEHKETLSPDQAMTRARLNYELLKARAYPDYKPRFRQ